MDATKLRWELSIDNATFFLSNFSLCTFRPWARPLPYQCKLGQFTTKMGKTDRLSSGKDWLIDWFYCSIERLWDHWELDYSVSFIYSLINFLVSPSSPFDMNPKYCPIFVKIDLFAGLYAFFSAGSLNREFLMEAWLFCFFYSYSCYRIILLYL